MNIHGYTHDYLQQAVTGGVALLWVTTLPFHVHAYMKGPRQGEQQNDPAKHPHLMNFQPAGRAAEQHEL